MAALPLRREHFEIAIICVLETEGNAIEALFTETFCGLGKAEHDENFYVTGIFGGKPVVLVAPRNMGVLNAADAVNHMRLSFTKIRLALVTGVAGGAPHTPKGGEILLGDVLISTQVLQSDFGRMYAGGIKIREGPADGLGPPRQELANFLKYLQRDKCVQNLTQRINEGIAEETLAGFSYPGHGNDHLFPREYPHRHRGDHVACKCEGCLTADDPVCDAAQESRCAALQCDAGQCILRKRVRDCVEPTDIGSGLSQHQLLQKRDTGPTSGPALPARIHFGAIASSSQVLKSSTVRDELAKTRKVIGFEMEGAGCWAIFPTIVVKSVCDYADGHKDKQWQPYASALAACCAREIVEKWQTSQTMGLPIPHGVGSIDGLSNLQVAPSYMTPDQNALREAILTGLFVMNPPDDLYAVNQRIRNGLGHAPGTCQWIQEHASFKKWLDHPTPQILSLVGPPGIGKSTLSTFILSFLQHKVPGCRRSSPAFFFCDAAVATRRTYLSVVRSILWQLLKQGPGLLPTELVSDYHMQGSALFANVQALSRHLFALLHTSAGETTILVDGLDEIENSSRTNVFQFFTRLCRGRPSQDAKPDVRIILTHHPGRFPNHANQSPDSFQIINIDQEWVVERDVYEYIDAEISELSATLDWDEEITEDVRRTLQERSGSTFLWAALALRSLQDARSDNVLDRLEDLPPGLDAMYERLLRDIPHRERPTAAFALHCVVANVSHLTEITLGAMLACLEGAKSGNHFPAARRTRQLRTAWKSCQAFLRVEGLRSLRSIHQSVEYFFQEKTLPEDLVQFRFDRSHTLSLVTRICENYLASPTILRFKADIQNAIHGSRFASNNQETHAGVAHGEFVVDQLMSSGDVQQAKQFINATRYLVASYDNRTYLHCLAEFNVACAVRLLLDAGDEPLDLDSWDNAPLHVAAEAGSFESVKLLFNALPSSLLANDRFIEEALIGAVNASCARSLRLVIVGSGVEKVHRDQVWASLLQRNSLHIRDCAFKYPLNFAREMQTLNAAAAFDSLEHGYGDGFELRGRSLAGWRFGSAVDEWEECWSKVQPKYRKIVKILDEAHARFDAARYLEQESEDGWTDTDMDSEDAD
ncbi:hypothetical protein PRZ48_012657 [Zasmidium cellare]|uniref:AAA+ ATPase domain-containing protein n=1 Tax=Zasmidium cellare TaxID=395010 RepID=A0ABR0E609_ZASCE|nr:hypothetical protein PRZ48_012657 [Zasmidium cellare]